MDAYKLSERSDEDLANIYEFGIEQFGLEQARKYILGLHETFESLAKQSFMGIDTSEIVPELRRVTFRSHMIFYLSTDYGAKIIRVLHQSMDYQRHVIK